MAHRRAQKEALRAERLRREEEGHRHERRLRRYRLLGWGAMGLIAITLVALATLLGNGRSTNPTDPMAVNSGKGPATGRRAPDFALTDVTSGRRVTLASLRGRRTMLFFSEGVSCQACLVQAVDLERSPALRRAGIALVSVTTDPADELAQAVRQYGLRTPMLSDASGRMSAAYGMLGHGGMGHPDTDGHAFMLLGRDGKVLRHRAYREMYVKPAQLLRDLEA